MFSRILSAPLQWRTLLLILTLFGLGLGLSTAHADDQLLDPSQAFVFSADEAPGEVDLHFTIAHGYHLYREHFAFAVTQGQATLGPAQMPAGVMTYDEAFGKNLEVYRGGDLTIRVPVGQASGPFDLTVTSQGCADVGVCYPPDHHLVHVSGAALGSTSGGAPSAVAEDAQAPWYTRVTSAGYAQSLLEGHGFLTIVALYFVAGMVLSLLPCSYPMIPILSAIIVGEGAGVTRARALSLSLIYVLGMACVYTVLGILAASVGQALGAWLQNPWVLGAFALLLALFAAALIAGVDIALPQRWQDGAARASASRPGGRFAAVAIMGALSALVVGACMTAPLFAVLTFIAHTGNVWLGGAALFAMGLGLGVPLMIVGLGAGTLLPRAGAWMDGVKTFFGALLLAAALWIVWPVLGATLRMVLCAAWLALAAALFGLAARGPAGATRGATLGLRLRRICGAVCAVWAVAVVAGLAAGSSDPFHPLAVFAHRPADDAAASGPAFGPVHSSAELNQVLQAEHGPVLLDFYADWCVSCKEMEHFTFSDGQVAARLAQMRLLRADVTANNADDQALLKRFGLFGPPGIIVFVDGRETGRVVGYQAPGVFLQSLDKALASGAGQP